jgi:TrmH family RNA methyltransferase
MERISSRQNPLVRRFRELSNGTAGDSLDVLLDGDHLIREAIASNARIEVAAFLDHLLDSGLADEVSRRGGRVVAVTAQVLAAMSPVRNPSGFIAIASLPRASLDRALEGGPQLLFLLHDVQDPGNVGAIIRAAEGCGATGVIALERTADPFGWKALRGAMGSTVRIPTLARQSLDTAIEHARARRLRVLATVPRDGTSLPSADLRRPCAILLGGEGSGLAAEMIDAADDRLTIPMRAGIESLNVAVAAAIVLYEASRQRMERNDVAVR